ncbi:YdbC family protein [Mycoplasmopsis felifaucium]|uniref:PC4/YdbC family ssDNA-binding protein n=1 Tax=Mycoplasmopsis felifaucium TaxID=35768 RepID=A0ABZ2RP25_9BACT|nr:PC4/YdbC family ssDNA-binding protein [Mycoplasmopsis felifaucium]
MAFKRPEITNKIERELGTISITSGGYKKELNFISWNGSEPKYDIRDWSEDHSRSSKGITLTYEELVKLHELIGEEIKNH